MNTTAPTEAQNETVETNPAANAKQPRKRRMAREPKADARAPENAGTKSEGKAKSPNKRGPNKIAAVIALLERTEGATLAEMVEATGWLPHTTRAALTGLKKKSKVITKGKRDDVTCYFIARPAA